ncbi:MAG: DUF2628 domain-containing protein [Clostridia bacterium]|nr:DUF2628 domain-containing protein [Clostridia bacterium]
MSLDIKGLSCVHCKAYIFEEDDIVYCPVCGAPHHRECYNQIGHCALEELHGTENEYSKEKIVSLNQEKEENEKIEETNNQKIDYRCRVCGEVYPITEPKCPECNSPNLSRIQTVGGFYDPFGGVNPDKNLGKGVTASEAARFVLSNPHRYIPKFDKNKKISWNWMGFLFPANWLFSRKMYKIAILVAVLLIVCPLLSYPLTLNLFNLGVLDSENYLKMMQLMIEIIPKINPLAILASYIGIAIQLSVRLVCGLFGDRWYRNYTINTISEIKTKSDKDTINEAFRKKGGINFYAFMLSFFAINYLPQIILSLI